MATKARRALKAAIAVTASATLIFSLAAATACSRTEVKEPDERNALGVYVDGMPSVEEVGGTMEVARCLNTVLKNQTAWHSVKQTYSTAIGTAVTTTTYKDFKDGVLIAEELVYGTGFGKGSSDSHQFMFITEPEDERSVYVREGSAPASAEAGPETIEWSDEAEYWSELYYNEQYGLFMDQISLYVINEQTLGYTYDNEGNVAGDGIGVLVDNGDGTYSQTFEMDTVYSVYYYAYSMVTHSAGMLKDLPTFEYARVTFTFNEFWEVIEMLEEDKTQGVTGSTCTTTTYFEYGKDKVDAETHESGLAFFEKYAGTLEMKKTEDELAEEPVDDYDEEDDEE